MPIITAVTPSHDEVIAAIRASEQLDTALFPLLLLNKSQSFMKQLNAEERAPFVAALDALAAISNAMAADIRDTLAGERTAHGYVVQVTSDEDTGLTEALAALDTVFDDTDPMCDGTCYECTQADRDEFWGLS